MIEMIEKIHGTLSSEKDDGAEILRSRGNQKQSFS